MRLAEGGEDRVSRLKLHLLARGDFAKYHTAGPSGSELFVPASEGCPVGTPVTVEVAFQAGPRVLLDGAVRWRRAAGDARTRAGLGVGVLPSEQAKLDYLLGYVRGGLIDMREKPRLPIRLRVTYSSLRGRRVSFTRDLSCEGMFVYASELPALGEALTLYISPPGGEFRPIEAHGVVTRHNPEAERGVAVRFESQSEAERQRLAAFVKKLEDDYLDGALPDEALR
jgi:uncharacterized protein (TIGR02266 family)